MEQFNAMKCAVCVVEMSMDPEPNTRREVLRRPDAKEWELAMRDEYDSLMKNKTWDIVDRPTD